MNTDVVVLSVGHFQSLNMEELWINFGIGKHYHNIATHDISKFLKDKAKALVFVVKVRKLHGQLG